MHRIAKIRGIRFAEQKGRCCYCELPMWQNEPQNFAQMHKISSKRARLLQATAEHLIPRSEGGKDCRENIAAACIFCNKQRHHRKNAPAHDVYKLKVINRMAKGKWHPANNISCQRWWC